MSLRQSLSRVRARRTALTVLLAAVLSVPASLTPLTSQASAAELPSRPGVPVGKPTRVVEMKSPQAKAARAKVAGEKKANQRLAESAAAERRRAVWPKPSVSDTRVTDTRVTGTPGGDSLVTLRAVKPSESSRQARSLAAGKARITVLDQKAARRAGVTGVVFTVAAERPGAAQVTVDYGSFASSIGADWSSRLRLVTLPSCALTTPQEQKCRATTVQASDNDTDAQTVTSRATIAGASAAPTVMALTAAAAAGGATGTGDPKVTPLSASANWQAGSSSGGFSWSYPIATPPAAAGPAPSLSLSYDSGSIDGRTANTNNQGSLVGEGFDLTSSYVERKYSACEDDGHADKFDLCWKYTNASLVLNGKATELVLQDAKDGQPEEWHLKDDDASKVTRLTGADNGDEGDGEYWKVVTGDGTTYTFGLNKLPGADTERTNSTWTVPVFGNDAKEPGFDKGTEFKDRALNQAWRWNLDLVEDVHGNASTYWYKAETNNYAKNGDKKALAAYDRGGYLEEIRYGQRGDTLFTGPISDKVTFTYKERCTASDCSSLTEDTAKNWPDVPFESICSASETDCEATGPSFFTRKRLTGIDTYYWSRAAEPDAFQQVDSYALGQTFFDGSDIDNSSDQVLTLTSLVRTGKNGTDIKLPPVEFTYHQRPNRVDATNDNIPALTRPRMASVISETGAISSVTYSDPECVRGSSMPAAADDNNRNCYPVYWPINGGDVKLDWFHKYRVTAISTNDPGAGNQGTLQTFEYSNPGWHYNDDPFTKDKHRTWSTWRGYQKVTSYSGEVGTTRSKSVSLYMQGMYGDKRANGTSRTDTVQGIDLDNDTAATGGEYDVADIADSDHYAGQLRQQITYDGARISSAKVNNLWHHETASQQKSYAHIKSNFVKTAATYNLTYLTATKKWRTTAVSYAYDTTYGMATRVLDHGDWNASGDDTCTRTWYARNAAKGLTNLVSRTRTVAKACSDTDDALTLPTSSATRGDVLTDSAVVYDDTAATGWTPNQTPTLGLMTWAGRAKAYPAASGTADRNPSPSAGWQTVSTTTYDTAAAKLGRPLKVTDAKGRTTTTAYFPAAAGPLFTMTVTAPRLASNSQAHQTGTNFDPARGTVNYTIDANVKSTEHSYDALGRITATWLPGRSKSANATPNATFDYGLVRDKAPWSSVSTLKASGTTYDTTYAIYDSQLRPIQTQTTSPNGGRILTDTHYDARGLAYMTFADVWDIKNAPSGTYSQVPYGEDTQTNTEFDGVGRAIKATRLVEGEKKWDIVTTYTGDSTASTAVQGGNATRTITDSLGRVTETRTYAGTQPNDTQYGASSGTPYTRVGHAPTRDGKPSVITGIDDTKWSYTYDLFGRQVKAVDPDKGTTVTTYTDLDQVDTTKDDEERTLLHDYDELGRRTALWQTDRTEANQLAAWTFDSVLKGLPTASTRYEKTATGRNSYTKEVTAYDDLGRATSTDLKLPASDPLVTAGAIKDKTTYEATYRNDGTVNTIREPAAGGLAGEIISHRYNSSGLPTELSGTSGYLLAATYTGLGQVEQLQLGTSTATGTKRLFLTNTYEPGTGRLTEAAVDDQTRGPVQDLGYTYDQAGNVTAISDGANIGTGTDNQCFTYDAYRRLTNAWTPKTENCTVANRTVANLGGPAPYWTSYSYTVSGQRKTEKKNTGTPVTTTYCYDTARPHALTATSTATSTCTGLTTQYQYDDTGNTKSRVKEAGSTTKQTLAWNTEGKLSRLTDTASATATNYLYDADGELLIRRDNATNGETVLYLGATEVHLKSGKVWANRYYSAAGATIALRTNESGTVKLSFLAGDHHGTSSLSVTADSNQTLSKRYTSPFGAGRGKMTGVWPDDKGFLGMSADGGTGLTHVGAREYDPSVGQFISVDPILQLDLHQTLNGYSYGMQNPSTFSDPDGLAIACGKGNEDDCPANDHNGDGVVNPGQSNTNVQEPDAGSWEKEGHAKEDRDGDGYVAIFPGVFIPAEWSGKGEFIDLFYDRLRSRSIYGLDFQLDNPDSPVAQHDVSESLFYACRHSGCPEQKKFLYNMYAAYGTAVMSEGGLVGRSSLRPPKKSNCKCFLAGTDVLMADGIAKDIEDVEVGDIVQATDPETGKTGPRKVTRVIVTEDDKHFNELSIATADGVEELTATHEHPLWSPSERRWVEAGDLAPGMTLLTGRGYTAIVTGNRAYVHQATTYNLTVAGLHTYYVLAGATPVLVHNSSGLCGPGFRTASQAGISPNDARRIQNAADKAGQPVIVVGSRANGSANPASDWDYILSGPSRSRHSQQNSLPRGTGDGEGSGRGRDFWQNYNPSRPDYAELDPSKPYVIFEPRSR